MARRSKRDEKAVSPVVATVLLIAVVIVLALIVFLWLRGVSKEAVLKFDENVELVCDKVDIRADYLSDDNAVTVSNQGNYHLSNVMIKFIRGGEQESIKTSLQGGIASGSTKDIFLDDQSGAENINVDEFDTILVVPVLLGDSNSGRQEYICDDNQGVEINVQ